MTGRHPTRNSDGPERRSWLASGRGAGRGRSRRAPTDATGAPVTSVTSSDTAPGPASRAWTRRLTAPVACSSAWDQENGSRGSSPSRPLPADHVQRRVQYGGMQAETLRAEPAPDGRLTLANTSSSRRHMALTPRKAGP